MSIIQKNIFGDNVIFQVPPNYSRVLDNQLKKEILSLFNTLGMKSATIRFENGAETKEFAGKVRLFLLDSGVTPVNTVSMGQSDIERNEFSIKQHPSDTSWAMINIGNTI